MPISSENWLGTSSPPSPTPGSGCCSVLCSKISQMCGNACFQCQRDLNGIRVPWPDSWITIRSRVNFRLLLYYIRRESILLGKIWRSKLRILILFKTWKSVGLIIFSLQRKNNFFYVCWIPMHERHASRFCFSIWWTLWKKKKKKVNRFTRTSSVSRHRFVRIVNGGSQTVRNFSATLRVSR